MDFWTSRDILTSANAGTFSSVYLARDRQNNLHWNEYWSGEPAAEENLVYEDSKDKVVALKKILATSSPQRIENELHILESLRWARVYLAV